MRVRPWMRGDCASLAWGKREFGYGVILEFYNEFEGSHRCFAKVQFRNGAYRIWPVGQLKPAGHTIFTFRHLVFSVVQLLGYGRNQRFPDLGG
jgi:hypothetical protein